MTNISNISIALYNQIYLPISLKHVCSQPCIRFLLISVITYLCEIFHHLVTVHWQIKQLNRVVLCYVIKKISWAQSWFSWDQFQGSSTYVTFTYHRISTEPFIESKHTYHSVSCSLNTPGYLSKQTPSGQKFKLFRHFMQQLYLENVDSCSKKCSINQQYGSCWSLNINLKWCCIARATSVC